MNGREEINRKKIDRVYKDIKNAPDYIKTWALNLYSNNEASTCYVWVKQVMKFTNYMNTELNKVDINQITLIDMEKYLALLKDMSGSYKCTTRCCLRNFFDYLNAHGYQVSRELIPKAQKGLLRQDDTRIKSHRKDYKYSTNNYEQFKHSVLMERSSFLRKRNMAILCILANTGIRRGAIISADLDQLDYENHSLRVIEKEGITVNIPLDDESWEAIIEWLDIRNQSITETKALFISQKKTRLNEHTVYNIIKKHTGNGPHKLRANFATNARENGADIYEIQVAMNHKNLETTKRYFIDDEDQIRREVMAKAIKNIKR